MLAAAAAALVLLHGNVTIGPERKPAAHLVIEFTQHSHIKVTTTDSRGRFSVRLVPGTWTVLATRGVRTVPGRLVVRSVASQRANFHLLTSFD